MEFRLATPKQEEVQIRLDLAMVLTVIQVS